MFTYDLLSKNVNTLEIENLGVVNLYNTDNLIEKINDLQRRLNEKDIENRKIKAQLRK